MLTIDLPSLPNSPTTKKNVRFLTKSRDWSILCGVQRTACTLIIYSQTRLLTRRFDLQRNLQASTFTWIRNAQITNPLLPITTAPILTRWNTDLTISTTLTCQGNQSNSSSNVNKEKSARYPFPIKTIQWTSFYCNTRWTCSNSNERQKMSSKQNWIRLNFENLHQRGSIVSVRKRTQLFSASFPAFCFCFFSFLFFHQLHVDAVGAFWPRDTGRCVSVTDVNNFPGAATQAADARDDTSGRGRAWKIARTLTSCSCS